jgi:hypothetical protein
LPRVRERDREQKETGMEREDGERGGMHKNGQQEKEESQRYCRI